jgi:hypothetical protein
MSKKSKMSRFVNPYSPHYPADPKFFADREEKIEEFRESLLSSTTRPPRPGNIAVFGDWGIGKTSMLRMFEHIACSELKNEVNAVSTYISLDPHSCRSFDTFSVVLYSELKTSLKKQVKQARIKAFLDEWEIKPSIDLKVVRVEKKSDIPSFNLKESLVDLWETLEKAGVEVALIELDDVHFAVKSRGESLLHSLRSMFQDLPRYGCSYMLAIASSSFVVREMYSVAEPFTRFFDQMYLDNFDLKGTEQAILKPIEALELPISVEGEVIAKIHEVTDGHPYFISFFMHELAARKKAGKINLKFFDEERRKIIQKLSTTKFKEDVNKASERERKVLVKIAKEDTDVVSPQSVKVKDAKVFSRLVEKDLLTKEERGMYRLYHLLFKEYLRGL